ncbi:Stf0 family sulfotransferase [Frigidibacter sp. MR17.14]|uniref:Stf0 family sulfotransferase n=1 Tax=Frigidibacter sp. MR17.14 TaxID=3126509 RepID=UPI003012A186
MASFLLCTTPRSGSTLLCSLLTAAGLGRPDSFLMPDPAPEWRRRWGLPPGGNPADPEHAAAMLAAVRWAGRSPVKSLGRDGGAVFGMRLMADDLPRLVTLARATHPDSPGEAQAIAAALGAPVFLHLVRRDRLAQAVSLVKAGQTGLWHRAPDGTEVERLSPPAEPVYDAPAIARAKARLAVGTARWARWFRAEGVTPLVLDYEDLAADPQAALAAICARLGRPPTAPVAPEVAVLSDAVNRDWIARFRAETPGASPEAPSEPDAESEPGASAGGDEGAGEPAPGLEPDLLGARRGGDA